MKNKIIQGIFASMYVASFILFVYWFSDFKYSHITGSPSGWVWFSVLITGVFFDNLKD